MSKLSKETRERIEADSISWSENQYGHDDVNKDYLEGALHEVGRAQVLVKALEDIKAYTIHCLKHLTTPNHDVLINKIDEELAKYKEVGNA